MLEVDTKEPVVAGAHASEVSVPDDWTDYYDRTGPLQSIDGDGRRFARMYFRTPVTIRMVDTLPAVTRGREPISAVGKDISRGGISFLSSQQLYPGELGETWPADRWQRVEVLRCRKHGPACYEIGAEYARESA